MTEPTVIEFLIPARPVPQPRQRHRIIWPAADQIGRLMRAAGGRPSELRRLLQKTIRTQSYQPSKHPISGFKEASKLSAISAHTGPPLSGPLHLTVVFLLPRPQSITWKTKPMPAIWHEKENADADNLVKGIKDALTGVLWGGDGQVCIERTAKVVCSGDWSPCALVRVEVIRQLPRLPLWAASLIEREVAV